MGEVRTKELELSLQILGVDEHVWLDMRDIDMDTGLPDEGYRSARSSPTSSRTRSSRSDPTG